MMIVLSMIAICNARLVAAQTPHVRPPTSLSRVLNRVGFTLSPAGRIVVRFRCPDGYRANCMLDTGSNVDLYTEALIRHAEVLRVLAPDAASRADATGKPGDPRMRETSYSLGGVSLAGSGVVCPEYAVGEIAGQQVDGLVGAGSLASVALLVDARSRQLVVVPGGNVSRAELRTLGLSDGYAQHWSGDRARPTLAVRIDDRLRADFVVDTGGPATVLTPAQAHALRMRGEPGAVTTAFGTVGTTDAAIRTLDVGPFREAAIFAYCEALDVPNAPGGALGCDVLYRYRLLIDFPAKTIYLAPTGSPWGSGSESRVLAAMSPGGITRIITRVPSEIDGSGSLLVRLVALNGDPAEFALETAASVSIVTQEYADRAGSAVSVADATSDPMRLGGSAIPQAGILLSVGSVPLFGRAAVLPTGQLRRVLSRPIAGAIGCPQLSRFACLYDPSDGDVRLIFPGRLDAPCVRQVGSGRPAADVATTTSPDGLLRIPVQVTGGSTAASAPSELALESRVGATTLSRQLAIRLGLVSQRFATRATMHGPVREAVAVLRSLTIGGVRFTDVTVRFPADDTDPNRGRSYLGRDVLRGYRVLVDWPAGKFYLFRKASAMARAPRTPAHPAKRVSRRL